MPKERENTRRTGAARVRGRAAQVVERVFGATGEELRRVGYGAMRVEDVAARSGVHKTTIYRRWTTKAELVSATITAMFARGAPRGAIETGTVRGDLRASLLAVLDLNPVEQGVLRIMQVERAIPEVNALARRFSEELHAMRVGMVKRAIARGELPEAVDADLVVDLLSAVVQRALLFDERPSARYLDRVLDLVLAGAAALPARSPAPAAPPRAGSTPTRRRSRAK